MIIDTFIFDGPHEADLLYTKLQIESPLVDYFILQENTYNFKGQFKDIHADKVLQDPRFNPFKHKIIVESRNENIYQGSDEGVNFHRERWQRCFCFNLINKNCGSTDTIIISDVDESLEFSDSNKADKIIESIDYMNVNWVLRRRYWYDFDSECKLKTIRIPIIPAHLIKDNGDLLHQSRHYHHPAFEFGSYENSLAWEYSYCFKNIEDVLVKKQNYSHTGFDENSVRNALKINCWVRPQARGEKINKEVDFFEIIELNESNSPRYVREHLQELKTNIVDPNYKENRETWTSEYT